MNESTLSWKATVISVIEAEKPLLSSIGEDGIGQMRILVARASRILWVTGGSFLQRPSPEFALASGVARSLILEQPTLSFFTFDVPKDELCIQATPKNLIAALSQSLESSTEYEFAQNKGIVYISRFVQDLHQNQLFQHKSKGKPTGTSLRNAKPCVLLHTPPGRSMKARFQRQERIVIPSLQPGYIEVETLSAGLSSQTSLPAESNVERGIEVQIFELVGTIERVASDVKALKPGDRVVVMASCSLQTYQIVPVWACLALTSGEPLDVVCTLPHTYSTALYALKNRAQLEVGETLLVHGALSTLGMAAIQVAKLTGADVLVTVGTQAEKNVLVDKLNLDESSVFISNEANFVDEIMAATNSLGVDVLFNLHPSGSLQDIWRTCASLGRFVQLDNSDLKDLDQLERDIFRRKATFSVVNLNSLFNDSRPKSHKLWSR